MTNKKQETPAPPYPGKRRLFPQLVAVSLLWVSLAWSSYYLWPPLVFIALVPFAQLATGRDLAGLRLGFVWISGALYFGAVEYWFALYSPAAWLTLAALQSLTLLPVVAALRATRGLAIPSALTLSVFWVAGEYLRTLGPFGFPNGALAPVLYRSLGIIQIADLGGMFLVSFAAAMVSGALWDIGKARATDGRCNWRIVIGNLGGIATVWVAIALYGHYRLAESAGTLRPGPWVAVIQPDVPTANDVGDGYDPAQHFKRLVEWSNQAAGQQPAPALLVWPESSLLPPLNEEFWQADANQLERTLEFARRVRPSVDTARLRAWLDKAMHLGRDFRARIQALADERRVNLLVGAPMRVPRPATPGEPWINHNAAYLFRPHLPPLVQQKVHLFPVTERIPFVGTWLEGPFRWLAEVSAAHPEFELEPGATLLPLEISDGTGAYRFTVPICGEIDLAATAGVFLPHNEPRFVVNISDDGSFQRSAMLQVRQSMLAYRAVESRSGLARSANTGVSCFVRPTGEIYGAVQNARSESWTGRGFPERPVIAEVLRRKASPGSATTAEIAPLVAEIRRLRAEAGVEGYSVQRIDLDTRRTLYSRIGDLFPQLCTGALILALFAPTFRRRISA